MLKRLVLIAIVVAALGGHPGAQKIDITGKWTASFDTQIGQQHYTYDFVVKDGVLTGKAKSNLGEAKIPEGKVEGDKVTFVELLDLEGMEIRIDYSGTITSADEIKFTRKVGDVATEELVAKRAKSPDAQYGLRRFGRHREVHAAANRHQPHHEAQHGAADRGRDGRQVQQRPGHDDRRAGERREGVEVGAQDDRHLIDRKSVV